MDRTIKISLAAIVAFAITIGTLGTILNQLVLTVNDGKMPVKVFDETGVLEDDYHQEMTGNTKLNFLGDVILIDIAGETPSVARMLLAIDNPLKTALWGEGLGVCYANDICVASPGDVMRWIFALLLTLFFGPFTIATFHELWIIRKRK